MTSDHHFSRSSQHVAEQIASTHDALELLGKCPPDTFAASDDDPMQRPDIQNLIRELRPPE